MNTNSDVVIQINARVQFLNKNNTTLIPIYRNE